MNHLKAVLMAIKQRWLPMLVLGSTFAFIAGYLSLTNQINQERLVNDQRTRVAVEQVRKSIDENGNVTREGVELLTCIVILNGGTPPSGLTFNQEFCKKRIEGTNNSDGTFLSNDGGTLSRPQPQPTAEKSPEPPEQCGIDLLGIRICL